MVSVQDSVGSNFDQDFEFLLLENRERFVPAGTSGFVDSVVGIAYDGHVGLRIRFIEPALHARYEQPHAFTRSGWIASARLRRIDVREARKLRPMTKMQLLTREQVSPQSIGVLDQPRAPRIA